MCNSISEKYATPILLSIALKHAKEEGPGKESVGMKIQTYQVNGSALKQSAMVGQFKNETMGSEVESKNYLNVVDFDDHLNDPSLDWRNTFLNAWLINNNYHHSLDSLGWYFHILENILLDFSSLSLADYSFSGR